MSSPDQIKTMHQIFVCRSCGMRFPVTNNALEGVERCVMCDGEVDIVDEYVNYAIPDEDRPKSENGVFLEVVLDNVRSAWNVGSMFRTADAAGVKKVYICGISPTPENDKVGKTALGAENVVPWEYHNNSVELVKKLQAEGYQVWAMEYTSDSENLFEANPIEGKIALVFGHEVGGVDPGILRIVNKVVHLPMNGTKNSMNVAVAFGVAVYRVGV